MTLGRPPIVQDEFMNLPLPLDGSLDAPVRTMDHHVGEYGDAGLVNTASFFIATMYVLYHSIAN